MNKNRETTGRKYEVINGHRYEFPCYKKGHQHTIDCCTPEMWDAASEEAYSKSK